MINLDTFAFDWCLTDEQKKMFEPLVKELNYREEVCVQAIRKMKGYPDV